MDMNQLHQNTESQIDQEVSQFKKRVDKIEQSDNPKYKDEDVKQYEINQARQELEQEVKELTDQFNSQAEAAIEDAEQRAATSFHKTSQTDLNTAEQALSGYITDALLAYNDQKKADAGAELENRLEHFSEQQLAAVRKQLPQAIQQAQGDEVAMKQLRSINSTLSALQTPEERELDDLKALKEDQPDTSFRRLKITHPSFKDLKQNRSGGKGIVRTE